MNKKQDAISASWLYVILILLCLFGAATLMSTLETSKVKREQIRIYNRINNMEQSLRTKDKELEAGLSNTQNGLMLKIDYLEKQIGVGE